MGKCNSKENQHKVIASNKINASTGPIAAQTNGPNTIPQVRSEPPRAKDIKLIIRESSTNNTLLEQVFPGQTVFSSVLDTIKPRLNNNLSGYEILSKQHGKDVEISNRIGEPLLSLFPNMDLMEIYLLNVSLDIPLDVKAAYIQTTNLIASPKFESPFEIVTYDKVNDQISYFLYKNMDIPELKKFNHFSAYCNGKDKLYISGGDKSLSEENFPNSFVEFDLNNLKNSVSALKVLPNLHQGRGWHSMIFIPNKYIFIVGGIDTKSVEVYDTHLNEIKLFGELNEFRSECSLCCVNNSSLYVFFGYIYKKNFNNTIEMCNLRSKSHQFTRVSITLAEGCIFEPSFFTIAYANSDKNSLILLGVDEESQNKHHESKEKSVRSYRFTPSDQENALITYAAEVTPLEGLFSEKFFIPINPNTSMIMPMYSSDEVKIISMKDGLITTVKFEEMHHDTTYDEIVHHPVNLKDQIRNYGSSEVNVINGNNMIRDQ
jgi:hypothetical protein